MMNNETLASVLEDKALELSPHYKPGFLHRRHTVFQFHFDHDAPFYLTVTEDKFEFAPGAAEKPTISLFVDSHETCWGLIEGRFDGMRAFMEGKYRADGNIVLSQLLLYLFKSNDPTNIYEVQD